MKESQDALLEDMQLALRSELGARTLYPLLGRRTKDPELGRVLERMAEDERELVGRLQRLLASLGAKAQKRSFRRWLASLAIAAATLVFGLRFALRLSQDAEETVARWYGTYRAFFLELEDPERARECDDFAQIKLRHAQWLDTWIQNARFRQRS